MANCCGYNVLVAGQGIMVAGQPLVVNWILNTCIREPISRNCVGGMEYIYVKAVS